MIDVKDLNKYYGDVITSIRSIFSLVRVFSFYFDYKD